MTVAWGAGILAPMKSTHISILAGFAALVGVSAYAIAQDAAEESTVPGPCNPVAEVEAGDPILCEATLTPEGKPLFVRLFWDILADTDELHVMRIETAATAGGTAISSFTNLDSRAWLSMNANGFEFTDMNFDGYADFRLIEFLPAGPNIAYINALYDPAKGKHVSAPSLNVISAPEFDADSKTVISMWRGNAATHGQDVFGWEDGDLMLRQRTISVFDENGNCMLTTYEPIAPISASTLIGIDEMDSSIAKISEEPC